MTANTRITVSYAQPALQDKAQQLAKQLDLPVVEPYAAKHDMQLMVTSKRLELCCGDKHMGPVFVDFLHGKLAHRHQYGGGKGQLIAKAVGFKSRRQPLRVLDATAGLAEDGFVLASLGCSVLMLERAAVIAALVQDALERARFTDIDLKLLQQDALDFLKCNDMHDFDVIYLDPMFSERVKSALVKKEMRMLRQVVGNDDDVEQLLQLALQKKVKRVVVKRALHAEFVGGVETSLQYRGKSTRFDVYIGAASS